MDTASAHTCAGHEHDVALGGEARDIPGDVVRNDALQDVPARRPLARPCPRAGPRCAITSIRRVLPFVSQRLPWPWPGDVCPLRSGVAGRNAAGAEPERTVSTPQHD